MGMDEGRGMVVWIRIWFSIHSAIPVPLPTVTGLTLENHVSFSFSLFFHFLYFLIFFIFYLFNNK